MIRKASFIKGIRDSADPLSSSRRRAEITLRNGEQSIARIKIMAIGVFKENPRRRQPSKQIKATASAAAIQPPRENVKINATPPPPRTAIASHFSLRPRFVNRMLAADAS